MRLQLPVMKKVILCIILSSLLTSCFDGIIEPDPYSVYRPILMSRESLEKSITFHVPDKITDPGKIYFKDDFIFISEEFKGVHIIDNKDPKNPVNKGYLEVAGCVDMAIKDNTLYVDNATDLVALDLTSLSQSQVRITKRVRDALPELTTPDGRPLPEKYTRSNWPSNAVLVGWTK